MSWEMAVASAAGQYFANQQKKKAAGRQMGFQERMSNTAYQRGMADMKAAGLNPILAYKKGGASTPQGATYNPENIGAAATEGFSKGSQAALNQANVVTAQQVAQAQNQAGVPISGWNTAIGKFLAMKKFGVNAAQLAMGIQPAQAATAKQKPVTAKQMYQSFLSQMQNRGPSQGGMNRQQAKKAYKNWRSARVRRYYRNSVSSYQKQ